MHSFNKKDKLGSKMKIEELLNQDEMREKALQAVKNLKNSGHKTEGLGDKLLELDGGEPSVYLGPTNDIERRTLINDICKSGIEDEDMEDNKVSGEPKDTQSNDNEQTDK
ncbi:MAG: hypothetical protein ACI93R_004085 [Flavobacteriales bacterium]|jgi:hypothetical protein